MTSNSHHMRHLLSFICLIASASILWAASPAQKNTDKVRAKAKHFFMLSNRAANNGNHDEAYELARKARQADPSYPEAAWDYASYRIFAKLDTLRSAAELARSVEIGRQYVDAYPHDYFESASYADWAMNTGNFEEALRIYQRIDSLFPTRSENLPELADAYLRMNRAQDALDTYARFERAEGPNPQVTLRKISIYFSQNDTVSAINEVDSLVERSPGNPVFRILRGNVFDYLGDEDMALANYQEAEKVSPESATPKLALAQFYNNHGDTALYDNYTFNALMCEDLELEQKLDMAGKYLGGILRDSTDNSQRVKLLFETLKSQYPHEPDVLTLSSSYHYLLGDMDEAASELTYAIDLDPSNQKNWGTLLYMYLTNEKYDKVVQAYESIPPSITPDMNLKQLYALGAISAGQHEKGLNVYRRIIADIIPGIDPDSVISDRKLRYVLGEENCSRLASIFLSMGDAYHGMGSDEMKQKAYRAYDNALFMEPSNPMTMNNYAYFLAVDGGDLEKAATMSHEAITIQPDNPTLLDTYAWVLYKQKDYEGALQYMQQALDIAEQSNNLTAEYFDHLGDIQYALGNVDEAVANWKKALELSPDDKAIQNKVRAKRVL